MQQTLYSKTVDDGHPPIPITTQSTIYTNPTSTPIFDYLRVSKFLSEFKTEVDKARVRKNLGIPDEYSYNWGHIGGSIENQSDLMSILNSLTKEQQKHSTSINSINTSLIDLRGLIGEGTNNQITILNKTLESLHKDLLALQINVAQNSTDIARLSGGNIIQGGSTSIDSSLIRQITTNTDNIALLSDRVSALEGGGNIGGGGVSDLSNIYQRLDVLETAIRTNTISSLEASQSEITVDNINSQEQSITITANYTKIEPIDVTSECTVNSSNSNVAIWNTQTHKIKIIGEGVATLTFMFRSKSVTVKVSVGVQVQPEFIPQWVGYANTYEDMLDKASVSTVAGTWNNKTPGCLNIATADWFNFWLVTTETIKSISEVGVIDIQSWLYTTTVINGKEYKVYRSSPIENSDNLTITISV